MDSETRDDLAAKHEHNREQRLDAVYRWVEYVENNPPEVWGEQLNRLIESQLEAARAADVDPETYERVRRAGETVTESE